MTKKMYKGMAWRTNFNEMRLPGKFISLKVHKEHLDSSLTRRSFQETFFRANSMRGAPKNLVARDLF